MLCGQWGHMGSPQGASRDAALQSHATPPTRRDSAGQQQCSSHVRCAAPHRAWEWDVHLRLLRVLHVLRVSHHTMVVRHISCTVHW